MAPDTQLASTPTARRAVLAAGLAGAFGVVGARTAGATTRSVEAVSVADYGAVGDGQADDTAAVRAAVSVAVTERRPLLVPPGTYLVDAPIRVVGATDLVVEMQGRLRRKDASVADSLVRFVNCTNLA